MEALRILRSNPSFGSLRMVENSLACGGESETDEETCPTKVFICCIILMMTFPFKITENSCENKKGQN